MTSPDQTTKNNKDIKDLLLEDYKYYGEWLQRNEESGEKRINLYITLLTAIPAGLAAISEKNDLHLLENKSIQVILLIAFAALLPFGIFIFLRLIKRNKVTDELKFTLDNIRQRYMDIFDEDCFLSYHMLPKDRNPLVFSQQKRSGNQRKWVSLVYLVLFLNTMVFSGSIYILFNLSGINNIIAIVFTVLAIPLCIFVQKKKIVKDENNAHDEINKHRFTHAGGIVFKTQTGGDFEYLLTTSLTKDETQQPRIIFPKGHIEPKEEISQAALREVFEETGVISKITRAAGSFDLIQDNNRINIKFYLMERLQEGETNEKRKKTWLPFEQAYDQLSFPESKRLLLLTHSFLLSNKKMNIRDELKY